MNRALDDRFTRRTSAALGIVLGSSLAAWIGCCPDQELELPQQYQITEIEYEWYDAVPNPAWVEGSGTVFVFDRSAAVRYDTVDGTSWRVHFREIDRSYCD